MNEDFEEDYEEDEDDGREDLKEAKDKAKDAKDKYNEQKNKKVENKKGSNNDPTSHNEAREFNKSLDAKNQARTQNPDLATKAGSEGAKAGSQAAANTGTAATTGTTATTTAGTTAATTGTTAAATTGTAAATGTTAAATAGTTAAATAGTTAAAAGGTAAVGGAVAAQAAIPVIGWVALAVEAAIAAVIGLHKFKKKHDKKMEENGVNSKGLRRLLKASPILLPIALIFLVIVIIIVLIQSETYDRVAFMQEAIECFESADGCWDFMNTGLPIGNGLISVEAEPLIRKTDLEIAEFVVQYKFAEWKYFGNSRLVFLIRYGR